MIDLECSIEYPYTVDSHIRKAAESVITANTIRLREYCSLEDAYKIFCWFLVQTHT